MNNILLNYLLSWHFLRAIKTETQANASKTQPPESSILWLGPSHDSWGPEEDDEDGCDWKFHFELKLGPESCRFIQIVLEIQIFVVLWFATFIIATIVFFCMSFQINCNIVQIDARLFRPCLLIQENCKIAILVNRHSIFFSSRKFFQACQSV